METKEGLVKKETFVFKGRDDDASADWTLTLRAEREMPPSYVKRFGRKIGTEILVTLGKVVEQSEL